VAGAVAIPVRFFHQRFKCRRISLVHEQVAGSLPAKHVARGIATGRAAVSFVTSEKIQKQTRVIEPPATVFAQPENISEELFARIALDENVLLGSVLVTKTRPNRDTLQPERHDIVEKGCHFLRRLALKQSAVDSDS